MSGKIKFWRPKPKDLVNQSYAIAGGSKSGKSVLTLYLVYLLRDIPNSFVFCNGEDVKQGYGEHIPLTQIFTKTNAEELQLFFDKIEKSSVKFVRKWYSILKMAKKKYNVPRTKKLYKQLRHIIVENIIRHGTLKYLSKVEYQLIIKYVFGSLKKEIRNAKNMSDKIKLQSYMECFVDQRKIIIFDDVNGENWYSDRKVGPVLNIIIRGRHLYITSFFLMHNFKTLGPTARNSIFYSFVMGGPDIIGHFYDAYCVDLAQTSLKYAMGVTTKTAVRDGFIKSFLDWISKKGATLMFRREGVSMDLGDAVFVFRVQKKFAVDDPPDFMLPKSKIKFGDF